MTTKKKGKGKTMPLTDFLAAEPKLVTVRATNWSEIVDKEEAETKPIGSKWKDFIQNEFVFSSFSVVDIGALPTAPRGAVDIDYSTVPTNPPFVAHVANLSFEIDDDGLRTIFADLNVKKFSRKNNVFTFEKLSFVFQGNIGTSDTRWNT